MAGPCLSAASPRRVAARGSVAAIVALASAVGSAHAQSSTNPNPGGHVVVGVHTDENIIFAVPTANTTAITAAVTEIVARLNGGATLYDQTIAGALGSPGVQAAIAAANAALLAAGGAATTVSVPVLLSQAMSKNTATSTVYALDPSTPPLSPANPTPPYRVTSSTDIFGPAVAFVANYTVTNPPVSTAIAISKRCRARSGRAARRSMAAPSRYLRGRHSSHSAPPRTTSSTRRTRPPSPPRRRQSMRSTAPAPGYRSACRRRRAGRCWPSPPPRSSWAAGVHAPERRSRCDPCSPMGWRPSNRARWSGSPNARVLGHPAHAWI